MRLPSLSNRVVYTTNSNKHGKLVQTLSNIKEPVKAERTGNLSLPNINGGFKKAEHEVITDATINNDDNPKASMRELIEQNKYEEALSLMETAITRREVKSLAIFEDTLAECVRLSNNVAKEFLLLMGKTDFDSGLKREALVKKGIDLANLQRSLRDLTEEVFDLIKDQPKADLISFSDLLLYCGENDKEKEKERESLELLEQIPFSVSVGRVFQLFELIEKQANPKAFPNLLAACGNYSSYLAEKVLTMFKVGQFQGEINEQKIGIKLDQEVYISGKERGIIKSYLQGFFEVQTPDGKIHKIVAENLIKHNPDILPIGMPAKVFNQDVLYAGFNKNDKGEIISFKLIDNDKNIFEIPSKIFLKENKLLLRDENFVLNNLHLIPNNTNVRYGAGEEGLIKGLTEEQKYFLVQNNKTNQIDKVLIEEIIRMNIAIFRGIPPAKVNKMGQTKLTYGFFKPENWIKATKYKVNEIEVILPSGSSVNHQTILNKLSLWISMGLPEPWIKAVKTIEVYPFKDPYAFAAANSSGDTIRFFDGENNFNWAVFNHEITHSLVMKKNKNINPNISHETWTKIANNARDKQFVRINGEKYAIEKETINSDFLEKAFNRYTTKIEELETKTQRTKEESLGLADDKLDLVRVNALRKAQANGINIESITYLYLVDSAGYTKLLLYHHPDEEVNKTIQELVEKESSATQVTLKHISILNELAVPVEEYLLAQMKDNNAVTSYGESIVGGIEDIPEFVGEVFDRYLIKGLPATKSAVQNLKIKQERLKEIEKLLRSSKFYALEDLNEMKESGELDRLLEKFPDTQELIDNLEEGNKLQEEQEELENSIKQIKSRMDRKRHLDCGEDSPVYEGFHDLKETINSWSDVGEVYLNRVKAFIENYILGGVSTE